MIRLLLYVVPIVLAIYALVDCVQTPDQEVRGLPKWAWIALIVLIWIVGPVAWLIAGRDRGTRRRLAWPSSPGGGTGSARPGSPAPGPLAPDDDPEFLRRLDWEQRRRRPDRTPDDEDDQS